jgi:excisionase family DNA binding protein
MTAETTAVSDPAELLTAADVAKILSVPEERVWELSRGGEIPTITLGKRTRRYRREAVLNWLEEIER